MCVCVFVCMFARKRNQHFGSQPASQTTREGRAVAGLFGRYQSKPCCSLSHLSENTQFHFLLQWLSRLFFWFCQNGLVNRSNPLRGGKWFYEENVSFYVEEITQNCVDQGVKLMLSLW